MVVAWARLIEGVIETQIASVAIVSPLPEDQACAYQNRRGMMGLVTKRQGARERGNEKEAGKL
ncbi:hypothetical protein SBA5_190019 [Candidatus Sulfotelmatomonas gaucii]|uniref:Uncharacterized protein n=1 Tax=Candidatus Sulfuritelmatomonas gaucii TaxID=2043161 RepID=A0A2N9L6W8_9BACT|nr:hypothetical protein SBA5_190019 [Candidatus Sulfotelmatomonas gaucii]